MSELLWSRGKESRLLSDVESWNGYIQTMIRRSLFPLQNFLFLTVGTAILCHVIENGGRAAFEELATIASVPINTALVFMFGMTVSRSIGARATVHSQILKAIDYPTILSMLGERTGDTTADKLAHQYKQATDESLKIIQYIAYDAFADEVLWVGFRQLHDRTMSSHAAARQSLHERGSELRRLRAKMISSFQKLHFLTNGSLPPFHGVPLADPMGALLHSVLSPESTMEVRFAMITLSVLLVVSRSWSSDSALDLGSIIGWAGIIYAVILLPYSLIGSFVYKSNVWETHPGILAQGQEKNPCQCRHTFIEGLRT